MDSRTRHKFVLRLCYTALVLLGLASGKKRVHFVHWEKSNPMFRIDNTDNVIDVNVGNTRWQYDQANFVCPRAKQKKSAAQDAASTAAVGGNTAGKEGEEAETYIIYNVSKEEYDSCMVTQPSSRIVATCTGAEPGSSGQLYFTITFRSFTPTPGGLEFHPGRDYYFITTSVPGNLHGKYGGRCASHNMKVIFKVSPANATARPSSLRPKAASAATPATTTPEPQVFFDDKNKYYPVVTRRPLLPPQQPPQPPTRRRQPQQDKSTLETAKKVLRDFQKYQNEVAVKQEASRMHTNVADSAAVSYHAATFLYLTTTLVLVLSSLQLMQC
jgi:ephrin-B